MRTGSRRGRLVGLASSSGSQSDAYQRELVDRLHLPFAMLSDPEFTVRDALCLPTFAANGIPLYRRLTMIIDNGSVEHVFYPVFPPDRHAEQVVDWLQAHPARLTMTTSHTMAVVFDLDGTLVDTMTSAPRAYADTIRSLGGPEVSPSQVEAVWHIGPTPVLLEHFLGRPISPRDTERFHRFFDAVIATVEPFPGVVEMLDALGRSDYRLGVFTTATHRAATSMLTAAGLAGYFPVVVGGDEVSRPKPAPDGLELSCLRLGTGVTDTVYVGDATVDLQCAEAANASGIHAAWGSVNAIAPTAERIAQRPRDVVELVRQLQTK